MALPECVYRIPLLRKSGKPRALGVQLTSRDFTPVERDAPNRFAFIDENRFEIAHAPPLDLGTPKRTAMQSLSLLEYGVYRFKEIASRSAAGAAESTGPKALDEEGFRK